MIHIKRPEASNNGIRSSSPGIGNVELVGMAQKGPSRMVRAIERFVARRPGFCLAAAISIGVALGWWVKRR